MKTATLFVCVLVLSVFASAQDRLFENPTDPGQLQSEGLNDPNDNPPMLGPLWAQGTEEDNDLFRPLPYPYMNWHGGVIMPDANVTAIWWGKSWQNYNGDKIGGIASWYQGYNNSRYAATSNEYIGSNGKITSKVTYAGQLIDPTPFRGNSSPAIIGAEVCKMIRNPDPTGNGYYPVYVDVKRAGSVSKADYCGYHSWRTCGGVRVEFAFFWNLDGDVGCDPKDKSGLHSQGLAALANISGHELSESRTDPTLLGWYDNSGLSGENGDKCAWTFNVPLVTFSNATQWKIQGEWSNNAYAGRKGYPNRQGYKGCLSGQ